MPTLAQKLSTPGPVTLTDADRAAVADALRQLAVDQSLILRQERLLALSAEHAERVRALAEGAVHLARRHAATAPPDENYDYAAARKAREDLAELVCASTTADAVVAGALRLARIIITGAAA